MNEKVYEVTLKKGTKLKQWRLYDKSTDTYKPGNYYTLPGENPNKLGVNISQRKEFTLISNEDTKLLRSAAADIKDTWSPGGPVDVKDGSVQLFQTKVNATKII